MKSPKITASSGYYVLGFSTSSTDTNTTWASETEKEVSSSGTWYAHTSNVYKITLDRKGGSGGPDALYYKYNTKANSRRS